MNGIVSGVKLTGPNQGKPIVSTKSKKWSIWGALTKLSILPLTFNHYATMFSATKCILVLQESI